MEKWPLHGCLVCPLVVCKCHLMLIASTCYVTTNCVHQLEWLLKSELRYFAFNVITNEAMNFWSLTSKSAVKTVGKQTLPNISPHHPSLPPEQRFLSYCISDWRSGSGEPKWWSDPIPKLFGDVISTSWSRDCVQGGSEQCYVSVGCLATWNVCISILIVQIISSWNIIWGKWESFKLSSLSTVSDIRLAGCF